MNAAPDRTSAKRARLRRRLSLSLAGVLIVATVAAFACAKMLLCIETGPRQADVIVVLGGETVHRTRQALELFQHGAAPRIIVSGAGDTEVVRDELLRSGVPAGAIALEERSRNTKENAEFTAPLLKQNGVHQAILVTSWFHSRRALNAFHRFAPDIRFSSVPVTYHEPFSFKASHVFQEYLKTAWYSIRYGILPWSASAE